MIDHRGDSPATARPGTAPQSVVALIDAASGVERELVGQWLGERGVSPD